VLEAGAEDLKDDGSAWYIVRAAGRARKGEGSADEGGNYASIPRKRHGPENYIKLTGPQARKWFAWGSARRARRRAACLRELRYRRIKSRPLSARTNSSYFVLRPVRDPTGRFCLTRASLSDMHHYKALQGCAEGRRLGAMTGRFHRAGNEKNGWLRVLGVYPAARGRPATES